MDYRDKATCKTSNIITVVFIALAVLLTAVALGFNILLWFRVGTTSTVEDTTSATNTSTECSCPGIRLHFPPSLPPSPSSLSPLPPSLPPSPPSTFLSYSHSNSLSHSPFVKLIYNCVLSEMPRDISPLSLHSYHYSRHVGNEQMLM